MKVRTTAYTHTESDHLPYGKSSAVGTTLESGVRPQRGCRLGQVAGRHQIPDSRYRSDLRGRRLRLGISRPEYHRPLLPLMGRDEQLGGSPRNDPDPRMGRSMEKLPYPEAASRLRPCPQDARGDSELLLISGANRIPHKSQDVGLFLDDFADRLA